MKLISNRPLRDFGERHPDAHEPLQSWRSLIEKNSFHCFAELRHTFCSVDVVGDKYVFNIGGNKYRLVSAIAYQVQIVWVKNVLTHAEYDKGAWK